MSPKETAQPADEDAAFLEPDEPAPVIVERLASRSPFLILVDHAGRRIPRRLGSLGLTAADLERHIAWDLGALDVARAMSAMLDATVIAQPYSRLVIDCNRDPDVPSSIPTLSESTEIPGNRALTSAQRRARRRAIFDPYHERIRELLDARRAAGCETIVIAQHSMTDEFKGVRRPMHAAVLYNRDRRLASRVLERLRMERELVIGDNEPYFVSDATDYSIPRHAEARGLAHVEIEIRQDLLRTADDCIVWAQRLARVLREAAQDLAGSGYKDST